MSLVTGNGYNEFQFVFQKILREAKENSNPVNELRHCIGSLFQEIELLKNKAGERPSLDGDSDLFLQLGVRDEYIAKQISIIDKLPIAVKTITGIAIASLTLKTLVFGKKYLPGESDFPEGDPLLKMSLQGKLNFVGGILLGIIVVTKTQSVIAKWLENVYLQNQIRNDPQFADFVRYFQLGFTNVEEAKKICDIFEEFKSLNVDLNRLQIFEKN